MLFRKLKSIYIHWLKSILISCLSSLCETSTAINRSVLGRLECYLSYAAALGASYRKVFTGLFLSILLSIATCLASLGLIHKAFFFVECLLSCCEHALFATILTNDCLVQEFNCFYNFFFVLVHWFCPHFDWIFYCPCRILTDIPLSSAFIKLNGYINLLLAEFLTFFLF